MYVYACLCVRVCVCVRVCLCYQHMCSTHAFLTEMFSESIDSVWLVFRTNKYFYSATKSFWINLARATSCGSFAVFAGTLEVLKCISGALKWLSSYTTLTKCNAGIMLAYNQSINSLSLEHDNYTLAFLIAT